MIRRIRKGLRQIHRAPEVLRCMSVTPQWWQLTSAYVGVSKLKYPYEVRLRSGMGLTFADFYDVTTFWQIFIHETYAVHPSDAIIIDAGANIGSFSLYALAMAPGARVVAIEPFPSTFDRLRKLLDTEAKGRATVVNCALRGKTGTVVMDPPEVPTQMRRVLLEEAPGRTSVPAETLETVFSKCALDSVDFMKMDIEGSEYDTLLNASPDVLRRIRRISLEYHPLSSGEPYSKEQLFDHLRKCGFRIASEEIHTHGYGIAHFQQA
jgi:FkbM family methyltransferase